jgi:hypothetical protein
MAGVAILGSAVIGGISTSMAASKAAKAQTNAANASIASQEKMYEQTRSDLSGYRNAGNEALGELQQRMPELTSDINLDEELKKNSTVQQAYDFTKTQGLKAAQNSAAARGLGVSGAALKGASQFATGLAKSTYQDLFNMENTNRTNAYSRLKGLVDTGVDAAKGTATAGINAANQTSQAYGYAGNAQANAANATGAAVKGASQNVAGWAYGNERGLYGPNRTVDDVYF